jgi:hypothetical protein
MLAAESEREAAKQKVLTVTVTSEAAREAEKKLIAAKQQIQENKIREETEADVLAYMKVKEAEGERKAADLQYEAKLRLAEGDSQAAIKRAEGDRALKMVEVTVEREKVNVEQARVDVERLSLSNRQEFEGAALKFELEKMRIEAERDVRIQSAQAMGQMLNKAQMQIFGDPDTMARMSERFMRAASYGAAADGLLKNLPPQARELLAKLGPALSQLGDQPAGNGNGETVAPAAQPVAAVAAVHPVKEDKKHK